MVMLVVSHTHKDVHPMRSTFMFRLPAYARSLRCSGPGQLLQIWTTSAATAC